MRKPSHLLWGGKRVLVIYDGINDVNTRAVIDEEYDELSLGRGDWEDLSFLSTVADKVTRLSVLAYKCDFDNITCLRNLRYLRLDDGIEPLTKGKKFDFSCFGDLEEFHLTWQKFYSLNFLDLPKLRSLSIWKFPESTLGDVKRAKNLRFLSLNQSPIASLAGIECFVDLNELRLFNLGKLEDIKGLSTSISIKSLSIEKCHKITDLSSISMMGSLEYFYFTSKISLPDLNLLLPLTNLREFIFDCQIDLQDFHPLFSLKKLRMGRFILLQNFTATDEELVEMAHQVGKKLDIEVLRRGRKEQTVTFKFS